MKFSLSQLEYILALNAYGQFSTAAEKCFITQPTLSMQIKKMENDLDITIFDRSKQPIVATEIGQKIIHQAKLVLKEAEQINEIIDANKNRMKGNLRLGVIPTIAPYLLPQFIGQFAEKYPEVQLKIRELETKELVKALEKDVIDIGIASTPIKGEHMMEFPLYNERILIYAHPEHPIQNKEAVYLEDLKNENIWLLSPGHCFRSQVINVCDLRATVSHLPFEYESASIETLVKMVDMQGGITLIPELAVNDLSSAQLSNVKEIHDYKAVREVSLITNRLFVMEQKKLALEKEILLATQPLIKGNKDGKVVQWS